MAINQRNSANWLEGKAQTGIHLFLLSSRNKKKQIRVFSNRVTLDLFNESFLLVAAKQGVILTCLLIVYLIPIYNDAREGKNHLQFEVMSHIFSVQSSLRWLRDQIMLSGFLDFHQHNFCQSNLLLLPSWFPQQLPIPLGKMCMQSMIPFQLRESDNYETRLRQLVNNSVITLSQTSEFSNATFL